MVHNTAAMKTDSNSSSINFSLNLISSHCVKLFYQFVRNYTFSYSIMPSPARQKIYASDGSAYYFWESSWNHPNKKSAPSLVPKQVDLIICLYRAKLDSGAELIIRTVFTYHSVHSRPNATWTVKCQYLISADANEVQRIIHGSKLNPGQPIPNWMKCSSAAKVNEKRDQVHLTVAEQHRAQLPIKATESISVVSEGMRPTR